MKINIYADKGRFNSIQEAAVSEKEIDWWDDRDIDRYHCVTCHAATEISEHLKKAGCNTVLKDKTEQVPMEYAHANIFIGDAPSGRLRSAGRDGSISVRLSGERGWIVNLWGNTGREILFAAYQFLEDLGYRWYLPDERGDFTPDKIILKEYVKDLDYDFRTRACYNEFIDDDNPGFLLWASRNRMNMLRVNRFHNPHLVKKLGLSIMGGGHEIFFRYLNPADMVDPKTNTTYYDLHPEWFALIGGERSRRNENKRADEGYYTGDNICTSNVDGVSELAENMIRSFNSGDYRYLEFLNLWAYDNGTWCECDNCLDTGNLSRRMLMLAYDINRKFREAYEQGRMKRRIKLVVPVYHETLEPPDKPLPDDFDYEYITATFFPIERCYAHNINDRDCLESNSLLIRDYEGWNKDKGSNYRGEIFIGEYYNVSSFASLPFIFTGTIRNDIPYYHETGTRHLYYMHISARKWGMLAVTNNLLALLMRDVNADCDKFMKEMYCLLYPGNGALMEEFHGCLERASANSKYLKHYQFNGDGNKVSLIANIAKEEKFPLEHCKFDRVVNGHQGAASFVQTMKYLEDASGLMEKVNSDMNRDEALRIADERMRFEYGFKVMKFIFNLVKLRTAYESNQKEEIVELFKIAEEQREELMKIKEPLEEMKYECPWYVNAYEATWHARNYEELRKELFEYQ